MATRYEFNNGFLLLIKYVLIKFGFNVKLVAKIGDCTFELNSLDFERFVDRFSRGLFKSIECVNGRLLVNSPISYTVLNFLANHRA